MTDPRTITDLSQNFNKAMVKKRRWRYSRNLLNAIGAIFILVGMACEGALSLLIGVGFVCWTAAAYIETNCIGDRKK
ncbi:hypothetical protein [Comamonas odontotermitis]|uniref:hypothetical protein n=1 Tax=Comamonas odontotermitis TaxID=379895 RepID=UPI001CC6AD0E|nr:hypothetical protein [Comamonas odontotermitis]UBB18349.1 hypothetical protein LAD35_06845 [Comamonas odontotermitis]